MSGYDMVGWAFSLSLCVVIAMVTILGAALAIAWVFNFITKEYLK